MDTCTESKAGLPLRILRFPLSRLLLIGAIVFYLYLSGHMFRAAIAKGPMPDLAVVVWMVALTLAVYVGFVHVVECRPARELALPGMGRELGIGLLLGAGLYTVCILILMVFGVYRIDGFNSWQIPLGLLWFGLSSGFFEEMLFRGLLFRISEEVFGSWVALAVSSLAFGLMHLSNPGATFQGVLFIAIEAGVLLAAAYMLTGRLWLSMGFHMAWNFTQSAIFPVHVSGSGTSQGLVEAAIAGPDLLTGGIFGMESSLVALVLLTTTGVILLILAVRRGKIVPPFWKRTH
ncbi:MAG: CPBP family intramembrane metalloprotease [Anaerolineae bacterium]|nr:CPBP family intramembrane metalloprotease [Anaerolineae bacterium]